MKVAALDYGTNTFLLLIAEVEGGRVSKVLHDEAKVVRLGQGVHETRRLHPEALARVEQCLGSFSRTIAGHKADRVLACATSAARDVSNAHELIEMSLRYGIPVEVISGEREAELTFWGTIQGQPQGPVLIVDVGGGSTEFIFGDHAGLAMRKSIDVGSVRLSEIFVHSHPIDAMSLAKMTGYVQERISAIRPLFPFEEAPRMVAVAGTPTTLAAVEQSHEFESDRVHGHRLTLSSLRSWVQRLSGMTVSERQALAGMDPKRADVIPAGALILMLAAQSFQAKEMEVSVRGLRYGVAADLGRAK